MGVNLAGAEVHSEVLKWTVTLRVLGLIAILPIYFVPLALPLFGTAVLRIVSSALPACCSPASSPNQSSPR
jgi:hypothetical protein